MLSLLNSPVRDFLTRPRWFTPLVRPSIPPSTELGRIFSFGLCLIALSVTPCYGQTPVASISGYVSDSSDAVIVNADVLVRQSNTGFTRKTQTRSDGFFTLENLEPGEYEIEASAHGFRTSWRAVTLLIGDQVSANLQLQAGPVEERVEVTSDVASINTTNSTVKGNVTRKQIETLPLNGRNFLELAHLTPGVNVTFAPNPGLLGQSYLRVNIAGGFPSQSRIAIDGSTVTDRFVGGTMLNFSPEAVQEFQISTFGLDIQTGITALAPLT